MPVCTSFSVCGLLTLLKGVGLLVSVLLGLIRLVREVRDAMGEDR